MQDLVKIIKWRDEVREIEYVLVKLELAEELAVQEENYEKAQLMLEEQKRLIKRKKYLETKIKNDKQ
tara:strand:- start:310 stop:510 length:201 start_codon:yes stop_codon:yes gene_type:complete